jgi:hypothetical protein
MTDEELKWIKTNNSVCALLKQVHDVLALTSLPPRREWIGLTSKDRKAIFSQCEDADRGYIAAMVEAKLKEKNA